MINKFKHILNIFTESENPDSKNDTHHLEIATSVLFLELAYADFNIAAEEEKHIHKSLESFFSLTAEEVKDLISMAREKRQQRNDIWLFTDKIKNDFSKNDKIKILEMLWELVYADGYMDKYEESLMRKITTLMGLTHGEMVQAKLKAKS
jgi:uncharacterized tellurite resistance protein B-like protein